MVKLSQDKLNNRIISVDNGERFPWKYNPQKMFFNAGAQINPIKNIVIPDSSIAKHAWEPVFDVHSSKKIEIILKFIFDLLREKIDEISLNGLFDGKMGIVLFFFDYYSYTEDEAVGNLANQQLYKIANTVYNLKGTEDIDLSFSTGLSGISWAIQSLVRQDFISCDLDELLTQTDYCFKSGFFNRLLNYSLSEGLIGTGMYFLSRVYNSNYTENSYDFERESLKQITLYLNSILSEDHLRDPTYPIKAREASLSTGYLGIIPFLTKIKKLNLLNNDVNLMEALNKCIALFQSAINNNLFKIYSGWDVGSLPAANSFLQAGKAIRNRDLENDALAIALSSIEKDPYTNKKSIEKFSTIHIYNCFYQHFKLNSFKHIIAEIVGSEIDKINFESSYLPAMDSLGLKNGLSGIGLTLLGLINKNKPSWDQALLLG